ncbi:amino acid ABC transporter ATP-binding protein [Acerihabitans arboris]|uniref:ATP-binding cassette domain-containing protein n=1 Tax=Acerihabitans arboris TaxID=2691583 RepID=A0A845SR82_9GAMM|nr:amino acid ABC transporter ATP-binding protein [Acerihabitans arboris]NDL65862.1 ATP-binding cassette domain-containing protein [Acerihabitans arboris]
MNTIHQKKPIIRFESVEKRYGKFYALNGVHLSINAGQRVVICGPSGSGKSTLLRCINGLDSFQKGEIIVDGVNLSVGHRNIDTVRGRCGMVFQHFNLFPHMTVLQNCMLAPVTTKTLSPRQAKDTALELLERVKIKDKANHYPGQLSGGQQQRVAIARALCMGPKLMLLDEPTSALDPEMIAEVLEVITDLAKTGITLVCVTHEMNFAKSMADRLIFMDAGKILEDHPPIDFFNYPETDRAKSFLSQILRH